MATALSREFPGVAAVHMEQPGRGRALRAIWAASDADVLAYMDVDLSTDLNALLPLVAPLLSGHSDIAIGTRLARGSRVIRGPRREVISRSYNLLLRASLGVRRPDQLAAADRAHLPGGHAVGIAAGRPHGPGPRRRAAVGRLAGLHRAGIQLLNASPRLKRGDFKLGPYAARDPGWEARSMS